MTQMLDTCGEEIPLNYDGSKLFNLTLWSDGKMTMPFPAFITMTGKYTSAQGVLEVSLKDILEDYLQNSDTRTEADEASTLANMLRTYANKIEAMPANKFIGLPMESELEAMEVVASLAIRDSTGAQNH